MGANFADEAALLTERAAAARALSARLREEAEVAATTSEEEAVATAARGQRRASELREQASYAERQATAGEDRVVLLGRADALVDQMAATDPEGEAAAAARAELAQVRSLLDPTGPEARQPALRAARAAGDGRPAAEDEPLIFGRMAGH